METTSLFNTDKNKTSTYSSIDGDSSSSRVHQAAQLIRDAYLGFQDAPVEGYYDPYDNKERTVRNAISILCGKLVAQLRGAVVLVCWTLFMLTFFEPPTWCRDASDLQIVATSQHHDANIGQFGDCEILFEAVGITADMVENQALYPNFDSMLLTIEQSRNIEISCVVIIFMYMLLEFGDDGFLPSFFFYRGYKRWVHTSQCIILTMFPLSVLIDNTTFNPFFRMAILGTFLRGFQREMKTLLKMIPDVIYVLSMLGIIVIFYAWFGVVMFANTSQGRTFPNLLEGMWTLWISVTTANYPDVSMDSFNENRLVAVFWVSFMSISFFYIMNLILAVCTQQYDKSINDRKVSREKLAKQLLSEAFALLDFEEKGLVCRESIMNVMAILNKDIPEVKTMSSDEKSIFYALLDRDGTNSICLDEFLDLGTILLLKLSKESDYATWVETKFPAVYQSQWYTRLSDAVKSNRFDIAVDIILVLNAITIFMQDYSVLVGHDTVSEIRKLDTNWERLETLFTVLYVLEVMLKVTTNGWKMYTESARNIFDFFITCMTVLASFYIYYPNAYNNKHLIRFIVMARVLRLVRLLFAIESFRLLGAITLDILPASRDIFLVLLFVAYFFATVGQLFYGGYITRDPTNPLSYALLEATDFTGSEYWANSFNDMFSSMNVLFNLLVVNNWPTEVQAFECTTGGRTVRLFFFTFHLICVTVLSNVITSVVINSFFQQLEVLERRYGQNEQIEGTRIRGSRAFFRGSVVTGTNTGVVGGYSAHVKAVNFDVDVDERQVMRKVFTRSNTVT